MATNLRLPMRNRTGPQRPRNADENAMGRHVRQASGIALAGASRVPAAHTVKNAVQRPVLTEVTTAAVNRTGKDGNSKLSGKEKETVETGLKRSRSASLAAANGPQRVPLGVGKAAPTVAPTQLHNRLPQRVHRPQIPLPAARRVPVPQEPPAQVAVPEVLVSNDDDMEIEDHPAADQYAAEEAQLTELSDREEELAQEDEGDVSEDEEPLAKRPRIWPDVSTERAHRYRRELEEVRENFVTEPEEEEVTMVSEYADDIFEYMHELEEEVMPDPDYMDGQTEINWQMRQTLVDWLLQVHLRYHLLPETLWIAVNIVDRFLTKRAVSLMKLQLVGVTAMFIAAKYEEILAPSVEEFVFMTERGYTKEEILKGERIMLQTLEFKISHYCSPYSWMRKISKADDYELQTRTLGKFLTEVTLLDHRFLRVKPSLVAAIGMYTARRMLNGDWNEAFIYYSGYTEEHLIPGHRWLIQKLAEEGFAQQHVCKKYAHKKFLKASLFAVDWAHLHLHEAVGEEMHVE
ncbi:hypothetical protein ACG7TL_006865 [Trametes sanguinea]